MCTGPRWTSICSVVAAAKSEWSACHTISTIKPASLTPKAVPIKIRAALRRDMPLPAHTIIVLDCATFPGTRAARGGRLDVELTNTAEQQRFRREVRAGLEPNVARPTLAAR